MQLTYTANHRKDHWWIGTFERKRFAQHAILRRAHKRSERSVGGLDLAYIDSDQHVTLVCDGEAEVIGLLADDLEDERIVDFSLLGTEEEFEAHSVRAVVNRLGGRERFMDVGWPQMRTDATEDPFEYDRRTLPALASNIVDMERSIY